MRLNITVRCSASLAALALSISPVWAQTGAGQPAETASNEAAAAQANDTATPAVEDEQDVVVTGLRRSLQSAQNLKRDSEQIIDAIVAEDIGKLPDVAVSDTAARIPGIQVQRERGEAGSVLLRGLDRAYYTTTYNGREIFTAETRSVALQDFPAGGISAIEAFKTSAANLVEPGLSGLINVRSRRPFDFSGFEVAGSVWANYPNQSEDVSPNAQLLISDRWDVGGGEIGALINFSYTRFHYQDSIRRHGFFIADLAGGRSPDWPEIHYNQAERWRPSINGALQWRPSPDLEFYVEGLWQGYRENVTDNMWAQPLWGGASYENIVRDGPNIISGTVNRPTACCSSTETWGFQGATKRDTNTYQFAVGGRWDAGRLVVSADIARTSSEFNLRTESVDYELNTNNFSVDWFTGTPSGPGPTFQVRGIDPSNPAIYNYRGFFEDYATARGDDWQARLDFEYETGLSLIPKVQAGVRFVDRDASNTGGSFYWNQRGRNVPFSAVPLDYQLFHPAFNGDNHRPAPLTWLAPTFRSVWDNLPELRQFNIGLSGNGSVDGPPLDPARTYNINERSYAGYAQVNYAFELGGEVTMDGAIGVRVVQTKEDITGTLQGLPGGPTPVDYQNEYTDFLPNANMRIRFSPEWQLRLAATETRTRPAFDQLNPAFRLDSPPGCSPALPSCFRRGNGGNPFLRPLDSRNYDASLEYYFSRNGFASVAAFRRDMRGFIATGEFQLPDLDPQGLRVLITGPFNTNRARIQGFEAQFTTFFDFEGVPTWLRRFGVQANATYIDATADFPVPGPAGNTRRLRIPDVSKWTYNLVGMYEGGGLTLRLAYNNRTGFPEGGLSNRGDYTLQGRGHSVSRLDWSSSYAVNEHLTLFFDWTNILGKPFRSDIVRVNYNTATGLQTGTEIFPMVVRFEESVLTGGVRFRF
ncbi:MAG TPA: TonB-dependent receptor [Allosphingosinicella sp.]|jgi:TonB-dependent receptor|nr:TonB-dependent receptor [Allosphingosinicella sp.]